MREFEFLFGRKPFADFEIDDALKTLGPFLKEFFAQTSVHFGAGRLNAATAAWVLFQVETCLAKEVQVRNR